MRRTSRRRQRAESGHALALARWEENSRKWNSGSYPELRSRVTDLQDLIGHGGSLWVVTSRRTKGKTHYSLSFMFGKCRRRTYAPGRGFGKFSVVGNRSASKVFATNDATLLLLSLRFDPTHPIDDPTDRRRGLGLRLQTPRALNPADVRLLKTFTKDIARWSVFVSYHHADAGVAKRLFDGLESRGLNTFRDKNVLRLGQAWWPAIRDAIDGARAVVVVVGKSTASSTWVKREIQYAKRRRKTVIPLLVSPPTIDAVLASLSLSDLHADAYSWRERTSLFDKIEQVARS